jgi:hypothetical protein
MGTIIEASMYVLIHVCNCNCCVQRSSRQQVMSLLVVSRVRVAIIKNGHNTCISAFNRSKLTL